MSMSLRVTTIILAFICFTACVMEKTDQETSGFPQLTGPYLGQAQPADSAEIFAPGIVSTALYTRDITFTPDGQEIYFCISALGYNLIYMTRQREGVWTEPEPASFITDEAAFYYEPHIAPDGKTLFFLSNMTGEAGVKATQDIWAVNRQGDDWGEPYNLGPPVNTDGEEFYPSTTLDGTLYFTRAEKGSRIHNIYRSRKVGGSYQEAEKLGPEVNCGSNRYNAFVDPQERFIIVPALGMKDSHGGTDYYISFRDSSDSWSDPVNMGVQINSDNNHEYSASLSPDGAYLFFMSGKVLNPVSSNYTDLVVAFQGLWNGNSNIYWVQSDFIWGLKDKSS